MSAEGVKRKLVAILCADVKSYSRLMGNDDVSTVKTLTVHREVISELVRRFRGRVVDALGDNLMAEFASAVDAVESAAEIQRELKARNDPLPDHRKMEWRIGINVGDVIIDGERLYGDGVNIAARLEGEADVGGICISGTVYDQVKNKLDLTYDYEGEHTVKNIEEPVRVYRVLLEAANGVGVKTKKRAPRRWPRLAIPAAMALILVAGGVVMRDQLERYIFDRDESVEREATDLPKGPLKISVIAAPQGEPWLTSAANIYNTEEHFIKERRVIAEVRPMDGLTALNKWAGGEFNTVPTAWLAESRAWVDQANMATLDRTGQDIFLAGGQYRAQPVVLSPLVWAIWRDAYDRLVEHFERKQISWKELHEAAVIRHWKDIGGGDGSEGKFKMVIPHPKQDPAGLTAIVGAAGAFYDKSIITVKELEDPDFLKWLSELLDTVVDCSPFGGYNMLLFGRSNGDAAQLVESSILLTMEKMKNRWDNPLVIVYPDPIAWFDFPYTIYMGKETTAAEKEAALDFRSFLLSADQQQAALNYGLRPASPDCPFGGGLISRWKELGAKERIPSTSRIREVSRRGLDALTKWYVERYDE